MFVASLSHTRLKGWNVVPLGERAAIDFCSDNFITVVEDPNQEYGQLLYYQKQYNDAMLEYAFILINPNLTTGMRLWVLYHEIAHFILHYPETSKFNTAMRRKNDREANYVAAVALLPRVSIEGRTIDEVVYETGLPLKLVKIRYEIFKNEGI